MTEHPELRQTTFGEVVAELLESRGLEASPFAVGKLAEDCGLDGWKVLGRMADPANRGPRDLGSLANALDLSEAERDELAFAFAFERRPPTTA
jgi:hypothetical protein